MNGAAGPAQRILKRMGDRMNTLTPLQRIKAADQIRRLNRIHEHYQAYQRETGKRCTVAHAMAYIPEDQWMVAKYSKLRTECQSVINSVIDLRHNSEMPCAKIIGAEVVPGV